MLFSNGCMGAVTVSTNSGAGEWLEFEAYGSKGQLTGTLTSLDARGCNDDWRLLYPGRDQSTAGDTSRVFRSQMERFINAVRGEAVASPTLEDVELLTRALVLGEQSYLGDGQILYI